MGRRREGTPARDGALPLGWAPLAMGRCREGAPGAGRRLGALADARRCEGTSDDSSSWASVLAP